MDKIILIIFLSLKTLCNQNLVTAVKNLDIDSVKFILDHNMYTKKELLQSLSQINLSILAYQKPGFNFTALAKLLTGLGIFLPSMRFLHHVRSTNLDENDNYLQLFIRFINAEVQQELKLLDHDPRVSKIRQKYSPLSNPKHPTAAAKSGSAPPSPILGPRVAQIKTEDSPSNSPSQRTSFSIPLARLETVNLNLVAFSGIAFTIGSYIIFQALKNFKNANQENFSKALTIHELLTYSLSKHE